MSVNKNFEILSLKSIRSAVTVVSKDQFYSFVYKDSQRKIQLQKVLQVING